jgi:predicted ATPase/class 3 adenylate cyclase
VPVCPNCGAENPEGKRFCGDCGNALALRCSACDALNPPGKRFCGDCGAPLVQPLELAPEEAAATAPATERRLVSVLFADLVGFTAASEGRDAEDTRELLSRYFEIAERLVSLYGGTVEKFIGDAVMAVWGAPVANEDDAERAVRVALDLVAAVPELDPSLSARAGVLTGEAAVTIGAAGHGMVAGDLVNTASRIQSIAEPGSVLVGEATHRVTEAAIAYEPAGVHDLKGKAQPVALHRALRVTAARRGALKSTGLEPPFVGRDRDLRLIKELFHASAEEGKAQLASVIGIAGFGKSRLAWEFEKYVDGLAENFWWHRGRCLAYGEGVAYWALAEMVRMRAGILEEETAETALEKLRASIAEHVADPDEQVWLEPRLAHLLALTERTATGPEDLFSAWRLFFERLADEGPVVLVFEDLHWADAGLLDFIEYLLEWSRSHPIFVLALARPDLLERRPGFASAGRNATTLSLEPLSEGAMEELLNGLVPGLPEELRGRILAHAEGVPLYAMETVRMLLDRELLARENGVYRPTGPVESLDVPESLQGLVAARLDGLSADERRLLQDGAVLGKSFTIGGLAALAGVPETELQPLVSSLVRKELLSIQADPRSPELGQYSFVQDLLKRVAYETLGRNDRKTRHLAAAEYLLQAFGAGEQEIVEVVAAHHLDAYRAAPDADDAPQLKARAKELLARAGERAASLAANEEAQLYFERAAELAEEPADEASLHEKAATTAWAAGRVEQCKLHCTRALELYEREGMTHPAARVSAVLGAAEWRAGELDQALERMESAFQVLVDDEPDEDLATLAAELGRLYFFKGESDLATARTDTAIELAESLWLPRVLSEALNTQGMIASYQGLAERSVALLKHALDLALEHDLTTSALRAYNNLADQLERRDRYEEAIEVCRRGLALARKVGGRVWEWYLLGELSVCLSRTGHWDEAIEGARQVPESAYAEWGLLVCTPMIDIAAARGDAEEAARLLSFLTHFESSADLQDRSTYLSDKAAALRAAGDEEGALAASDAALGTFEDFGLPISYEAKLALTAGIEAAFALGRLDKVEELLGRIDMVPPGKRSPFLRAEAARSRARLAAVRRDGEVEQGFKTAEAIHREHGVMFYLAMAELDHGEWLVGEGRTEEAAPLLVEAREIFESLDAVPMLERLDSLQTETRTEITA